MVPPCVALPGATTCGQSNRTKASCRRDRCRRVAVRYDRKRWASDVVSTQSQNWELPPVGRYSHVRRNVDDPLCLTDSLLPTVSTDSLTQVEIVPCERLALENSAAETAPDTAATATDVGVPDENLRDLLQQTADQAAKHTACLMSAQFKIQLGDAIEETARSMNAQFKVKLGNAIEEIRKEYAAVVDALQSQIHLLTAEASTSRGLSVVVEEEAQDDSLLGHDNWQDEEGAWSVVEDMTRGVCPDCGRNCTSLPNGICSRKSANPSDRGEPKTGRKRKNCKKE